MLRMDVDEVFAQTLEELERGGSVVDEGTALALGRNLTAYDALFLVAIDIFLLEHGPHGCIEVGEAGFDDAALSPGRIVELSARCPIRRAIAPRRILLPAPSHP